MAYSADIRVVEDNIISLLKNKDQRGMELLYDRYGNIIYGFLFQVLKSDELAEEAMEEVCMRVWRSIEVFDPKKERLFTWVINIARQNTSSKLKLLELNGRETPVKSSNNPSHYNPESSGVRDIVENLGEEQKSTMEGIYFMGLNHKYISEKINIPGNNLKNLVRSTLKMLITASSSAAK